MLVSGSLLRNRSPDAGSLCAGPSVIKRILIADDHEPMLRGLRALLGANPDWENCGNAVDGKEAVAKATELRPDLIVMDFAMPRMDGLRAAQEIRKLLPTVPIVLHTLYGTAEVERAAYKQGIRKIVEKTKTGALVSAVEELLSSEATSQPGAAWDSDETSEILASAIASPPPNVAVTGAPNAQANAVEEPSGTATPTVINSD
jgi:DNA-binding NarL/FixJ family response regulator